jgi:hypothetical protein
VTDAEWNSHLISFSRIGKGYEFVAKTMKSGIRRTLYEVFQIILQSPGHAQKVKIDSYLTAQPLVSVAMLD